MSFKAKRELLAQVAPRYREVKRAQKAIILDEFVAATGYARKYAVQLLNGPIKSPAPVKRPRQRQYGPEVQQPLATAWAAANYICAKRLIPFLPELVASLERHGHLELSPEVRDDLLRVSAATADRILGPLREGDRGRGLGATKAGSLLKHQVPVRTFADWDDAGPGFMEADLVAHCGTSTHGSYLRSLVLTDIATTWTECLALPHGGEEVVLQALHELRQQLPFDLLGLDTDNGPEFLNHGVIAYCDLHQITFTRGRAYRKNDQCFVEQKNGSIVRQIVGYDRYEGRLACRQLAELYRALRLYVNFFQPSMKLKNKQRNGAKVHRTYDAAQTPFRRLTASSVLTGEKDDHLQGVCEALDPVGLLSQIRTLQDAFWRHAVCCPSAPNDATAQARDEIARFNAQACVASDSRLGEYGEVALRPPSAEEVAAGRKRRYRRTKKSLGPRTYRTRPDPFEDVREELHQWFLAAPERTAKSLLTELQQRYPGQYPDSGLRTLHRRVKEWRSKAILEFDDGGLGHNLLTVPKHPVAVRAVEVDAPEPDACYG